MQHRVAQRASHRRHFRLRTASLGALLSARHDSVRPVESPGLSVAAGRSMASRRGLLLLRRHRPRTSQFSRLAAENKPAKEQRIGKDHQRRDRGYRIANFVACVHQTYADCQDDRASNPNPDLQGGHTTAVNCRVQVIIDAEEEERYPAQQIEVGMGWQGRVILADPHHDAPDHACDNH